MTLDWRSIDWGNALKSNIIRGLIVALVGLAISRTGHAMTPDMSDQLNKTITDFGDLLTMTGIGVAGHQRAVAQPESVAVIVPKKMPANPPPP